MPSTTKPSEDMAPLLMMLLLLQKAGALMAQWEWMYDSTEKIIDPVPVYDLYPEGNDNRSSMVLLTFNESSMPVSFSVCFWLYPAYFNATEIPLTLADRNSFFEIILLEGQIEVTINQNCPYPTDSVSLNAHHWHHFCAAVNDTSIQIRLNGEEHEIDLTMRKECKRPLLDIESLSALIGSNRNGFEFTGMVSNLQIFPRQLTLSEMTKLYHCADGPKDHIKNFTVETKGANITQKEKSHLCKPPPSDFLALFKAPTTQQEAFEFCQMLRGRLINESDDFSFITRQITTNTDVKDKSILFWTQELSEDEDHGYVLNINRGGCPQKLKYTRSVVCHITACMIPFGNPVLQKGKIVETLYNFPYKGKSIFQAKSGYIIYSDKCPENLDENCLVGKLKGDTLQYTELDNSKVPLGRKVWRNPNSSSTFNITLGQCGDGQFTCSNGQCIDLNNKCDGQPECSDESDEGSICLHIQKTTVYQTNICPESNPEVELAVKLDSVQEVSMERNDMSVVLTITSTWRDARVTFINLSNETTPLYYEEAQYLWYPKLYFSNARYEDNLNMQLDSNSKSVLMYYLQTGSNGKETLKDSYEVREHRGSDVKITRSVQYLYTFHCGYNYTLYPFDTQECRMVIEPMKSPGCMPVLRSRSKRNPIESELTTVSMYTVSKAHYCSGTLITGEDVIYLHLLLSRNFSSHVLTIFIPCIILCLLSMLTLTHFQLCNFTDRITVTLSLLIVLASLFSQVSSTLPESAEPKMVDMFFSYCIIRVSFAFFIHCSIEKSIRAQAENMQDKVTAMDPLSDVYIKITCHSKSKNPRYNVPRIINGLGITIMIFVDICVICIFSYMAASDHIEKKQRLDDLLSKYDQ